jgi:hypothetical protein
MNKTLTYEKFPSWIVIITNLFSVSTYFLGVFIVLRLGWIAVTLYLAFILFLEYRLLSKHCVNCYYWGKVCGFGKGRISFWFFKKGDVSKFCAKEMTWKDMIPDLLVSLVPFIIGIVYLIISFDIILLIAVLLLVVLSTAGNGFIRGSLTCKYCKQKELGCPAESLFNKENEE